MVWRTCRVKDTFVLSKPATMQTVQQFTSLSHLSCSQCGQLYSIFEVHSYATCCNVPLVAHYDLPGQFSKSSLRNRVTSMWRYREVLPVFEPANIVSLGEGMTPILSPKHLRSTHELPQLYIKDESANPTGSFKARGLSAAVSKAKEAGAHTCIVPTAGNAGGALAAYCAAAGMKAIVVIPSHTPQVFKDECLLYGAELVLVDGLISDCAKKVGQLKQKIECFDISTLKEPWRLEGKKTMGYEIAEQFDWTLPDVILYPTGGGTGLIGMWKAFAEMEQMGWIGPQRPRMIAVQAATCQPIVHTWHGVQANAKNYTGRPSIANGLAVPNPFAEDMILRVLRESGGLPIAIQDEDMIAAVKEIAKAEGMLIAPEGGALWKALLDLLDQQLIQRHEKILMLNTGSGYKYLENIV
ncbi:threonine synthase [Paraflavitalea speifideaquila]|uniref:threonine synthase n=1 Tax=Paraflavitalea speifideaquila TaxID=3076558 RepID=UPI0028E61C17|nr:threonine synthase [Paraflavitalea speifideiaquila]